MESTSLQYLVVFCDALTKWCQAFAVPDIKATVARLFVDEFVCHYSPPRTLLSNQGSNFLSNLMVEISKLMNVKHLQTMPYHPA